MEPVHFQKLYDDFRMGRIDRRTFLKASGLGLAAAVIAACTPGSSAKPSDAAVGGEPTAADWSPPSGVDLGKTLYITTWPNYHNPRTIAIFTALTGVAVELNPLGSNEEMLAKLLIGGTGWDVLVPTNYTFETYGNKGLLEPLNMAMLPHLDTSRYDQKLLSNAEYPAGSKTLFGFNKDWGTTGYTYNKKHVTKPMASWKDFFDLAQTDYSGKVVIHDYQLTSIGNALVYHGYSFNSVAGPAQREAAYAFLDFMAVPKVQAFDATFHKAPLVDAAGIALQTDEVKKNKITYPDAGQLTNLEFGTAELLTNQARADLWARFKSA